jgi:hypothetical protein
LSHKSWRRASARRGETQLRQPGLAAYGIATGHVARARGDAIDVGTANGDAARGELRSNLASSRSRSDAQILGEEPGKSRNARVAPRFLLTKQRVR